MTLGGAKDLKSWVAQPSCNRSTLGGVVKIVIEWQIAGNRESVEGGGMTAAHRRHDMTDAVWERLMPHLPGGEGKRGRPAQDNRRFIDAVCWILRTGAPWRDLPPDYGDWKNTHRRFCRWRDRGVWAGLLEAVIDDPDFEWLMIDASYIKAHPHSAGAQGGNQSIARTKGG